MTVFDGVGATPPALLESGAASAPRRLQHAGSSCEFGELARNEQVFQNTDSFPDVPRTKRFFIFDKAGVELGRDQRTKLAINILLSPHRFHGVWNYTSARPDHAFGY
jgi:hypothetical protein